MIGQMRPSQRNGFGGQCANVKAAGAGSDVLCKAEAHMPHILRTKDESCFLRSVAVVTCVAKGPGDLQQRKG